MHLLKFLRRTLHYLPLLLVLILALSQYACDGSGGDPCGGSPIDVLSERTSFRLVDESGTSLIGTSNAMYSENDVTVKVANGDEAPGLVVSIDGTFGFFISDDSDAIDAVQSKTYYLVLPPPADSMSQDIDTITAEYQLMTNGCNTLYDFMRIQYNDTMYTTDDTDATWELLKE